MTFFVTIVFTNCHLGCVQGVCAWGDDCMNQPADATLFTVTAVSGPVDHLTMTA